MRDIPVLRDVLENSSSPYARMEAVQELAAMVAEKGDAAAAQELLLTLMNDYAGEVVLGTAFVCAQFSGPPAASFQQATLATFATAGEMSSSRGAPLLRLAYPAALRGERATLESMAAGRPHDNGVARIRKLMTAVAARDEPAIFQLLAFSEGLDQEYDPRILERIQQIGADAFREHLASAIRTISAAVPAPAPTAPPPTVKRPATLAEQLAACWNAGRVEEAAQLVAAQSPRAVLEAMSALPADTPAPAAFRRAVDGARRCVPKAIDAVAAVERPPLVAHTTKLTALVANRDASLLASGSEDGQACLSSLSDGKVLFRFTDGPRPAHCKAVTYFAFLPDQSLLSGGLDHQVRIWCCETGKLVRSFGTASDGVAARFAIAADGRSVAIGMASDGQRLQQVNQILVYGLPSGNVKRTLRPTELGQPGTVLLSADGRYAVAHATHGLVAEVWDLANGNHLYKTPRHSALITHLARDAQGRFATADARGTIRLWRFADGQLLGEVEGLSAVRHLAFDAAGALRSLSEQALIVWNPPAEPQVQKLEGYRTSPFPSDCHFQADLAVLEFFEEKQSWIGVLSHRGVRLQQFLGDGGRRLLLSIDGEPELLAGQAQGTIQRWGLAPLRLKAALHAPLSAWTARELTTVERAATDAALPAEQRAAVQSSQLLLELCRQLCPAALDAQVAAPSPQAAKPWWQFW